MSGLDFLADAVDQLNDNQLGGKSILTLPIESVFPDPENPRQSYDEEYIKGLASSIDKMGLIQPIVVREVDGDEKKYYCNVGSNRVLAVKWLKENKPESPHSSTINAVIDNSFNQLGKLVENVQRNNLKPLEIARMLQEHIVNGLDSKELQDQIGKDKTWISRHLSLNDISEFTKNLVDKGRITNVEAILNFNKIYVSNEHYATCLIGDLAKDEKLSNAMSRKWMKNLKDNNVNPDKPLIEDEYTQEVIGDLPKPDRDLKVVENDDLLGRVEPVQENIKKKDENKAVKPKKEEVGGLYSPELKTAYREGVSQSYGYLIDIAENGSAERKDLAKQILISLTCNSEISVNWVEVCQHADLLSELITLMDAFKAIGYVSPLNTNGEAIMLIVNQQDLL